MTVAQLREALSRYLDDAAMLMESGAGLSRVAEMEFVAAQGAGAPAEVILTPSHEE
jgi:hypothetical protein